MGIAERKTRQKQELRTRILDAARRIVMREGFGALSMRKIADAIEYSPATLYLHFESRDAIARALCAEGYAQLLASFEPLTAIADAAERLKAIGRAYVAFGVAHPETYRLIFMEDPSYTGAALVGGAGADGGGDEDHADHADDKAFRLMVDSIDALKAGGRLPDAPDSGVRRGVLGDDARHRRVASDVPRVSARAARCRGGRSARRVVRRGRRDNSSE